MARVSTAPADQLLPGLADHPHARAILTPALPPHGTPSHAYLFHGPPGTGKRAVARAFAAALLADGAADQRVVAQRVERHSHPDLTWVRPSGAAEMLVADIQEPVVAAATRTPFESRRRVFVIDGADAMNDQAANRMLKTLEEPPDFTHLLLLADRPQDVLATISSRCQHVRFDPLAPSRMAALLDGVDDVRAQACARLALGDAHTAAWLAGDDGQELRMQAQRFAQCAFDARTGERPWLGLLEQAKAAGAAAGQRAQDALEQELQLMPAKERKRYEREGQDARRRSERRARTRTLDLGLQLVELWLRDVLVVRHRAPQLVHALDHMTELEGHAAGRDAVGRDAAALTRAVELVADTRLSLAVNVSEELALEGLGYRLEALLGGA